MGVNYTGKMCKRDKPVMPRNVEKLAPPSANHHSDIEAEDKRKWNQVCEPLTVDCYVLKHSAPHTVRSPSYIHVWNKWRRKSLSWQMANQISPKNLG